MRKWIKKLYRSKENLTNEEVREMIENNSNVILLDVRNHQEYEEGHLNGAINIPTYDLYRNAPKILKDKEAIEFVKNMNKEILEETIADGNEPIQSE